MKRLILVLITLSLFNSIFAQNDSITKPTINSKIIQIENARSALLNKINFKEYGTIKELRDKLVQLEDNSHISLYPKERWLIGYLANDFNDILSSVKSFNTDYYSSLKDRVSPANNLLDKSLLKQATVNEKSIVKQIDSSDFNSEEKAFLKLNLKFIIISSRNNEISQLRTTELSEEFNNEYPYSEYKEFVKQYLMINYIPNDIALGLNVGFGIRMNSGKIRNTIDEGIVLAFGIEHSFRKWDYNFTFLAGPVQFQKDLTFKDGVLKRGDEANYLNYGFSVARNFLESKKHKLSPCVGVGITRFTPYDDGDNKNYFNGFDVIIYNVTLGLNYQFKYHVGGGSPSNFNPFFGNVNIRYALSFHPTTDKLYNGFVHYLVFTWGIEWRDVVRDNTHNL